MIDKTCRCCGKTYGEVPLEHKTCGEGHAWFQCDGDNDEDGGKCNNTLLVKNYVTKGVLGGKSHTSEGAGTLAQYEANQLIF